MHGHLRAPDVLKDAEVVGIACTVRSAREVVVLAGQLVVELVGAGFRSRCSP